MFPDLTLYEQESILPFRQINNEDHDLKLLPKHGERYVFPLPR